MPKFSKRSEREVLTVVPFLQNLMRDVVEVYDCTILEGNRNQLKQDKAFREGRSKLKWPNGKHNLMPSKAVDAAPYPVDWGGPLVIKGKLNKKNLIALLRFYHFGGFVQGMAADRGDVVRWGGDWDGDRKFDDQSFHDLPHFEQVGEVADEFIRKDFQRREGDKNPPYGKE